MTPKRIEPKQVGDQPAGKRPKVVVHQAYGRFRPEEYVRLKKLADGTSKEIGYPVSVCALVRKFVLAGLAAAELE